MDAIGSEMSERGLYTDFESYRIPTTDEVDDALLNGIVAVDTNVLLNLYRYTAPTVDDFFRLLGRLDDRLFVPHQVLREFWRNRRGVLGNPTTSIRETTAAFSKNETSSQNALTAWAKAVALDGGEREELSTSITVLYDMLRLRVQTVAPSLVNSATPTSSDHVLQRLESLLGGKVGAPFSETEWKEAVEEGKRRVLNTEPPGYQDIDKLESENGEGASGDYLVWLQLMQQCAKGSMDLVLVTGDVKEDWWDKHRASAIGPRRELIEEFKAATDRRVFFLEPADFLQRSGAVDIQVSTESVHDVERVRDEVLPLVPWDAESIDTLLSRLENEGKVQADVIREAATQDGRITRERVYELDGRGDEQMLRGFTRPVARLTAELQAEGALSERVEPMLRAVYETGVKTSHFAIPDEVTEYLSRADRRSVAAR